MENETVEILDDISSESKKSNKGLFIFLIIVLIIGISVGVTILVMNLTKPKIFEVSNLKSVLGESKNMRYYGTVNTTEGIKCNPEYNQDNKMVIACDKELFDVLNDDNILRYRHTSVDNDELRIYKSENDTNYDVIYKTENDASINSVGLLMNDEDTYLILEETNVNESYLKIIDENGNLLKSLTDENNDSYYTSYEILYAKDGNEENSYITYFNCNNEENKLIQRVYNVKNNKEVDILKIDNISCRNNTDGIEE